MKGERTITVTRAEFNAMVAAMALYAAEFEGETDPRILRTAQRINEAHDRVITKWHEAGDKK